MKGEITEGARIEHDQYGPGTVRLELDFYNVLVEFDSDRVDTVVDSRDCEVIS